MWKTMGRLLLVILVVVAFFVGWQIGYRKGSRNATVRQLVIQAGNVADEILGLRRSPRDPASGFINEREQFLQALLANLTQRVTAKDLARDERSMDVMHYVQQYRRVFPYVGSVEHRQADLPTWPSSVHVEIERFLNALPAPKPSALRRLTDLFEGIRERPPAMDGRGDHEGHVSTLNKQ